MKRGLILSLWESLNKIEIAEYNLQFSYFIAKNKTLLKPEISAIDEIKKPSKRFSEYETKRIDLAKKYCDKDSAKNPIIINNTFKITSDNQSKFEQEMIAMKEEYKDDLIKREIQINSFIKFLDEEIDCLLYSISFEHLPEKIEPSILEIFIECNLIKDNPI